MWELVVMSKRRATIKDIAAHLGISHSTVSRALRNDSRISPGTIDSVRKAAAEIGYRPNILACGLVHNRSSLIGIVTSNVRGSFFADVIDGAQEILDQRRYSILLCCSNKNTNAERGHLETLIDKQVEGMIVLPVTSCGTNSRVMQQALKLRIPLVVVGTPKHNVAAPTVGSDNALGGYLAAKHLLERGHRRIVYITHSEADLKAKRHRYGLENLQRFEGYCRALHERGCGNNLRVVELDEEGLNMEPLRAVLHEKKAPTAFFAYSDLLAISAMHAVASWGYRVPEDVSIVGFDDIEFASRMNPALTTVAQPKIDMGRFAAKKIINQIEGLPEDDLICTPELIVRDSTASPPTKRL